MVGGTEGTRFRVSKRLSRLLLVAAGRRGGVGDAIFVQGVVARWRGLRDVRVVVSSELYKYLSGFRGARGKDTKAVARSVVALFSCRRRRYEGTRVSWNVVHVNS